MVGSFKTKLLTFLPPTIVKSKFKTSTLTSPQNKLTEITSIAMTVLYTNTMMTNLFDKKCDFRLLENLIWFDVLFFRAG